MRKYWSRFLVGLVATFTLSIIVGATARAAWVPSDLTIIQTKMTGTESVVLLNTSPATINLADYLVQYFNKTVPTNLATPTDVQALPPIQLPPNQSILLNGGSSPTCGAAAVDSLSPTLGDTAGYLLVVKIQQHADGSLIYTPQDRVSWTSATSGADITKVPSGSSEPNALWYRKLLDGTWIKGLSENSCNLLSYVTKSESPTFVQWATGTAPPATIISIAPASESGASSNAGLAAPIITEVLPNPAEPLTDADDEFIEIYNPNDKVFDLTDYGVQTSLTGTKIYKFPPGTSLTPKSFNIFTSADYSFTLSNSGGHVRLIDNSGQVVNQSEPYSKAKEGESWALANDKWYWTMKPSAGAANVINQTGGSAGNSNTRSSSAVKSASTGGLSNTPTGGAGVSQSDPLHPATLAVVGGAVILYAGYEYRNDVANQLHRFRRYREARRASGQSD